MRHVYLKSISPNEVTDLPRQRIGTKVAQKILEVLKLKLKVLFMQNGSSMYFILVNYNY